MSDGPSPLEVIAGEPNWVELDPPADGDDRYTLGYFRGEAIRVSESAEVDGEGLQDFFSGPYKITLILNAGSRMIFVDRAGTEAQNREVPTANLTAYDGQITATIPEEIVDSHDIEPGDRYWTGIDVTDGRAVLTLSDEGPVQATVAESFDADRMEQTYEFRFDKVIGRAAGIEDVDTKCDWFVSEDGFRVRTCHDLDSPPVVPEDVRARDPVKVLFEADENLLHYSVSCSPDHPVAAAVADSNGLSFAVGAYNGATVLEATPVRSSADRDFARAVVEDDGAVNFGVPEKIGDLLELYERSWIRLYWDDGRLYGLPTSTYGPAPILK